MKTVNYVPKAAQGDEKKFEGHVELRMPLYEERLENYDKLGLAAELDDEGKVVTSTDEMRKKPMLFMAKMLRVAAPYYSKVALKRLSDGKEFSCYEDLSLDGDCQEILTDVANVVIHGMKMGNG